MRILHVITRMILGGAQENTLLSVLGQMEAGHDVRLVTGPTAGPEGSLVEEALKKNVDLQTVDSLLRQVSPLDDLKTLSALRAAIREYRPDVVHTHSSKAGILGRIAAYKERVPFITHTIHGLPFHPYQGRFINAIYIKSERYAAGCCHKIIAVADAMTEKALAARISTPDKFVTVYSGMETAPFLNDDFDRTALRQKYGLAADDIVIGKVARLFELKGHEYLLESFGNLCGEFPKLKLFLVGDGVLQESIKRAANDMGVGGRIVFAGLVPHDRVAETIKCMDVLAHCSLREGLARVLPQALLSNVPTVSFDIDGAREVVINGETGWLVPPKDTAALSAAIADAIRNPAHARSLAVNGRELCRENFDWRHMTRRLLEIYESGLAESRKK